MRSPLAARTLLPTLAALAVLMLAAPLASAAEEPAHPAPASGGLSFLDLDRYDLGIYTIIVFVSLCLILYFFAWPKISAGLAKREADIAGAKDEALRAKADAEDLRAKLNAEFAAAQDTIRGMLDEARKDAEALRAREKEVGAKEAQAERERAGREIQAAKEQAMQEIQQQAIQLAALMSSKAVRRTVTADDHRRLLDESIAELKTSVTRA